MIESDPLVLVFMLQGKEIIQYYIDELITGGITYIPRFEDSTGKPRTKSLNEPLNQPETSGNPGLSDSEEEDEEPFEGASARE